MRADSWCRKSARRCATRGARHDSRQRRRGHEVVQDITDRDRLDLVAHLDHVADAEAGPATTPRDHYLDAVEHAAWTSLCLLVLNLDETLSKS